MNKKLLVAWIAVFVVWMCGSFLVLGVVAASLIKPAAHYVARGSQECALRP